MSYWSSKLRSYTVGMVKTFRSEFNLFELGLSTAKHFFRVSASVLDKICLCSQFRARKLNLNWVEKESEREGVGVMKW